MCVCACVCVFVFVFVCVHVCACGFICVGFMIVFRLISFIATHLSAVRAGQWLDLHIPSVSIIGGYSFTSAPNIPLAIAEVSRSRITFLDASPVGLCASAMLWRMLLFP